MHPCGASKSKEKGLDVQRRKKALFYIFCAWFEAKIVLWLQLFTHSVPEELKRLLSFGAYGIINRRV